MTRVLLLQPDESLRALLEAQLGFLGHEPVTSGEYEAAIVDPAAAGALDVVSGSSVPVIFVSSREPTEATRALSPAAHLTLPYELDDLARALAGD